MGKLLGLFIWLKARLNEPSTHASIAAVFAMAGMHIDDGAIQDMLNVGTLIFGAMGFFINEQSALTKI